MANVNEIYGSGNFLKAADLQGRRHTVVISDWEISESKFGKQIVLSFEGKDKKLSLNKTNAQMITNLLNTDNPDNWVGKAISLRPDKTQNPEGAMVDCIRVDFELPEQPVAMAASVGAQAAASVGDEEEIPF